MIDPSVLTNTAHNQLDPAADLNEKLRFFDAPPIQVNVRPNPLSQPNPSLSTDSPVKPQPEAESEQPDLEDVVTEETEETQEPSADFSKAFEGYFGMKPEDAMETVNQLVAFRDEMTLMRTWGVDPVQYDQRMGAVREFYNTLPEEGREQFNSIEGAQTIWEHLQKNGQAPTTTKRTSATKPASRIKQASTPKPQLLKKSEILKMDAATYRAKLPEITKAWAENRVIVDV